MKIFLVKIFLVIVDNPDNNDSVNDSQRVGGYT